MTDAQDDFTTAQALVSRSENELSQAQLRSDTFCFYSTCERVDETM